MDESLFQGMHGYFVKSGLPVAGKEDCEMKGARGWRRRQMQKLRSYVLGATLLVQSDASWNVAATANAPRSWEECQIEDEHGAQRVVGDRTDRVEEELQSTVVYQTATTPS